MSSRRPGGRLECVVVVAPGPWNETEETAKSWALREAARGLGAWVQEREDGVPAPEAWMEAQPASELTLLALRCLDGSSYLERCCQQARCHLSVETLGAAPGLRLGPLSFPNGLEVLTASRLQGPGRPPTVTGYWLCPGHGASAGKTPDSASATLGGSESGTRQGAPEKGPAVPPHQLTVGVSSTEVQC